MNRVGLVVLAVVVGVLAVSARVQTQAAQPPEKKAEQYTELEQAKVDLLYLDAQLAQARSELLATQQALGACYGVLGPVRAKADSDRLTGKQQALIAAIEQAHPGYTMDPTTGTLVKKPNPPKADPKAK